MSHTTNQKQKNTRKCLFCENVFVPANQLAKFCSNICREKHRNTTLNSNWLPYDAKAVAPTHKHPWKTKLYKM